jgi:hypothetical protein
LSAQQEQILAALLEGKTESEAAQSAGAEPDWVRKWFENDPLFVAEHNRRRKAEWAHWQERLRLLVPKAEDALEAILKCDDERTRLAAAVAILRAVGLFGQDLAPTGPTTESQVRSSRLNTWDF